MTHIPVDPALRAAVAGKRLVVFDYDGTLAELQVDWEGMRRALQLEMRASGFESTFRPLWKEMSRLRDERGIEAVRALFPIIARYEMAGVERQIPRPEIAAYLLHETRDDTQPAIAIFSANLHATVESGLRALGADPGLLVIGSDDVARWKPEPDGLKLAMQTVGVAARETIFIGDNPGDRDAAQAAGAQFFGV